MMNTKGSGVSHFPGNMPNSVRWDVAWRDRSGVERVNSAVMATTKEGAWWIVSLSHPGAELVDVTQHHDADNGIYD